MITNNDSYPSLWDYYVKTELPFTKILWEMERTGIRIDRGSLLNQAPKIKDELLETEKWFAKITGKMSINLKSVKEMGDFFFNQLKYKPVSYTEKGQPQLNATTLKKWERGGCEYSKRLLRYRDIDKKLSTYITNL